jgi:hypothetical protein
LPILPYLGEFLFVLQLTNRISGSFGKINNLHLLYLLAAPYLAGLHLLVFKDFWVKNLHLAT